MKTLSRIALVSAACLAAIGIVVVAPAQAETAMMQHAMTRADGSTGIRAGKPNAPDEIAEPFGFSPWAKRANAPGYSQAIFTDEAAGGGFLFSGTTSSYGARDLDLWIFKLDDTGAPVASSLYGGSAGEQGYAAPTSDGGYIAAGATVGGTGVTAHWIMKLDNTGAITWQKQVPVTAGLSSLVTIVPDGYVVWGSYFNMGTFTFDTTVMKFDLSGGVVWTKNYTPEAGDVLSPMRMVKLGDGSLMMYGALTSGSTFDGDMFLMKMNSSGDPVWTRRYGGASPEAALQLLALGDGTFLLAGATKSWGMGGSEQGPGDAWVLKLDAAGAIQWQFAYGGAVDEQMTVEVDPAGGYLLTGYTTSFGAGQEDAWVVKLNATGGIVWQKTYGGSALDVAFATSDSGGGYLLSGYTKSFGAGGEDVWVAKLDATGGIVWQNAYGDTWNDTGVGLRLTTGEILVEAQAEDPQAGTATDDVWFARMNSTGDLGQSCSFITPGAATATTSNGTATPSDATAVSYTVSATTASYSVTAGAFTKVPGPFSVSDLCGGGPGCTTDPECNDSNPCTNDACSGGTCTHANNTASCSDGNACTTGDVCSAGSCTPGTALNCNDGNACTDDACDPGTGCTHTNNTVACNDGNACTTGEACANGACAGGQAVNCDDGDACTTDSCNAGTGECAHAPLNCDDGDSCTADSCNPASGCVHTPLGCGPLQLLTPNGGGTLASGGKGLVSWQAPETAATFKLQYTVDNGSTWKTIADGLTGREYLWTVPVQPGNKTKCKVKLIAFNASGAKTGSDTSDATFTIEVIRLSNPNGGGGYSSGAVETIQWSTKSTKKTVAKVKLSYTTNGGSTWKTIVTLTGNPGNYAWTIPTVSSSKANCKVRVALLDSAGNSLGKDDSDLKFTINP